MLRGGQVDPRNRGTVLPVGIVGSDAQRFKWGVFPKWGIAQRFKESFNTPGGVEVWRQP